MWGWGLFPVCRLLGCGRKGISANTILPLFAYVCVCVKGLIVITWATFHFHCFLFILILFAFVPSSLIACRDKGVSRLEMRIRARGQGRVDPPIECIDCTKWAQCSRSNNMIAVQALHWPTLTTDWMECVKRLFIKLLCANYSVLLAYKKDSAVYMYISCIWNLLFCVSLPVFGGSELENRKQGETS